MGIKNLKIILNQKCQSAINIRKLDSYRGMILGIDLSIFLYKYLYNNDDHLEGFTRLILRLLKNQITPVFVFDGKPPKEKDGILQNRREKRDFMNIKKNLIENCIKFDKSNFDVFKKCVNEYINTTNSDFALYDSDIKDLYDKDNDILLKDCEKLTKKIIYVTYQHIDSLKKLFDLFGVRYIHAPCEAESLLAMLCKKNIIDGCISEDTDILPNGGHIFLRNFNADKNTIEEYCLYGILDNLKLNNDKFIDLCILCGCDYTTKINGLGPITAYKLICKYDNIENIIENNTKFIIPENFNYTKARLLFKSPISDDIFNSIDKSTRMTKPQLDDLKNLLVKTTLKDKFLKEINRNLMNYYLNIDGLNQLDKLKNNETPKITDFFVKE
jgi:flap endonuclease-1